MSLFYHRAGYPDAIGGRAEAPDEIDFLEEIVVPAAHLAVLLVGGLSGGSFIAENLSFIQCHCSTLDFVADGVRRTANFLVNGV